MYPNLLGEQNWDNHLPTCPSAVTLADISSWRHRYEILESVEIMVPSTDNDLYNPPDGYMCVFEAALENGSVPEPEPQFWFGFGSVLGSRFRLVGSNRM